MAVAFESLTILQILDSTFWANTSEEDPPIELFVPAGSTGMLRATTSV